ncbi:histidine--tRNA ligase [Actinomyces wuliandei]|uniref:histidine--tRNA ligase n=1 Tax=Actinomyces wuliandei TaxID=2057743 RepID=UPI000FDBE078|nr:histidine--tRNA ligase [Actinomyces wuliandei]
MRPMAQVQQAVSSLSGFPEWLPAGRLVEQSFLDTLRTTFELHGFTGIETRAVEPLSALTMKGETSKEVYLLSRLQAGPVQPGEGTDPRHQLGLHFDLTVPFARYVVDNAGALTFPFKRYQVQKVWRGERPQEGRFREFVQADIDVVADGTLPLHYDAELPLVMHEALAALPVPRVTIHVSNRKVAQGFYQAVGISQDQVVEVLRVVDKLDKIGEQAVAVELVDVVGTTPQQAQRALALARVTGTDPRDVSDQVHRALGGAQPTELLQEGLGELAAVLESAGRRRPGALLADLRIARGLDYYTGTVYESFMEGHEDLGSVCSGGRYDSLAAGSGRTYPGVGISIGLSRMLSRVVSAGLLEVSRPVPTCVLVAVTDEEHRARSEEIADILRARGISADVSPSAARFGKQIRFADRRGIPFVWFPASGATGNRVGSADAPPGGDGARDPGSPDSVKDIRSGEQAQADARTWTPPEEDLRPRVRATVPQDGYYTGSRW